MCYSKTMKIKSDPYAALIAALRKVKRKRQQHPANCNKRRVLNAIARCCNERHPLYTYYGGRGISICDAWLEEPWQFEQYLLSLEGHDMPGLWLDRIDNDGDYEPGNLRFVTPSQSASNRKRHKLLKIRHAKKCTKYRMKQIGELMPEDWWQEQSTRDPEYIEVDELLNCLNARSRFLLLAHVVDGHTLEELGKANNLSKERVRQICETAITRIRRAYAARAARCTTAA